MGLQGGILQAGSAEEEPCVELDGRRELQLAASETATCCYSLSPVFWQMTVDLSAPRVWIQCHLDFLANRVLAVLDQWVFCE